MRASCLITIALLVCTSPLLADDAPQPTVAATQSASQPASGLETPPPVRIVRVIDNHEWDLDKPAIIMPLGLQLFMDVHRTPALQSPSGYGQWHICEAIDDKGTDLRPPPPTTEPAEPSNMEDLKKQFEDAMENARSEVPSNETFHAIDFDNPDTDHLELQFYLGQSPRSAQRIAKLRGDVTVFTGGKKVTLNFPHLPSLYGKPLADPALKTAGLTIEPLSPGATSKPANAANAADDPPMLQIRFSGDCRALAQSKGIDVLDKTGQSVRGGFAFGVPDERVENHIAYITLSRPVDDDMTLCLQFYVDRSTTLVPFDLSGIPLP